MVQPSADLYPKASGSPKSGSPAASNPTYALKSEEPLSLHSTFRPKRDAARPQRKVEAG